mmetsp:Transcript_54690/g.90895  ORF Transcript_54690/g.90895 Transcript_54690/m.90895 type:complete len:227 (+) Transcript_54690:440-1120(+)
MGLAFGQGAFGVLFEFEHAVEERDLAFDGADLTVTAGDGDLDLRVHQLLLHLVQRRVRLLCPHSLSVQQAQLPLSEFLDSGGMFLVPAGLVDENLTSLLRREKVLFLLEEFDLLFLRLRDELQSLTQSIKVLKAPLGDLDTDASFDLVAHKLLNKTQVERDQRVPELSGVKVTGSFVGREEVELVDEDGSLVETGLALLGLLLVVWLRRRRVLQVQDQLLADQELL